MLKLMFCCIVAVCIFQRTYGGILFSSENILEEVDVGTFSIDQVSNLADVKNTGSGLFDHTYDNYNNKRLTLNFFVRDVTSAGSNYFRAHPVFMKCVQKVRSVLQDEDKTVIILQGFRTESESPGGTPQETYARSGTAVQMSFLYESAGDALDIAKVAVYHCPEILASIQRDLGVIVMSDRVHLHMTGADDAGPHYSVDGYSGKTTSQFITDCNAWVNESLDPENIPNCLKYTGLVSGAVHPEGSPSVESAVGSLDVQVTRDTEEFKSLMQFPGTVVEFEDTEHSSSWCGKVGQSCANCTVGIVGNALTSRCADRLMVSRMYYFMKILQKLVRSSLSSNKLKVIEAFDERHSASPAGDHANSSLHYEGRLVKVKLTSNNTATNLETITKLAICVGFDYVEHEGDHVLLAVKKQSGDEAVTIEFPETDLIVVDPPKSKAYLYPLPSTLSARDEPQYPLFDGDFRGNELLSENSTIGQFTSKAPGVRYFRLSPTIVKCYQAMHFFENNNVRGKEAPVNLKVVRGYLSDTEQRSYFDPVQDKRYNTHSLGTGFQIQYDMGNNSNFNIFRLAQLAVRQCALVFFGDERQYMGLGLYEEGVFLMMKDEADGFEFWSEKDSLIPEGYSEDTFGEYLNSQYRLTLEERIIKPDNFERACLFADPPMKQSRDFVHKHCESTQILKKRRKRDAIDEDECVPKTDTVHCQTTKQYRDIEVNHIWDGVKRKHLWLMDDKIKAALDACIGACGTCLSGNVYENKEEHCSNFLHWIPFELFNDGKPDKTNFYARDNTNLRKYACSKQFGEHCLDKAPLFAQMAPSLYARFRPNLAQSVEETLYSATDNPMPVFEIMTRMYALNAVGIVKFWVNDETEMVSLKKSLEVAMVWNTNVTEIQVYVELASSVDAVDEVIENYIPDWVSTGCPLKGRESITPFTVQQVTSDHRRKRDVDGVNFGQTMLEDDRNWERNWIDGLL